MTSLRSGSVPLCESTANGNGTITVKIIAPGWSSNNIYYSDDLLKRDGPGAFPSGTHAYWNHPTAAEDIDRPERSLRDLAAVTVTDAKFESHGRAGPGLYARIKAFLPFSDRIRDIASSIGVSIRAQGETEFGTAEGRKGTLATALTQGLSIDFVTRAAAGGLVFAESSKTKQGDMIMDTKTEPSEGQKFAESVRQFERFGLSPDAAVFAAQGRDIAPHEAKRLLSEAAVEQDVTDADTVAQFQRLGLTEAEARSAAVGRI